MQALLLVIKIDSKYGDYNKVISSYQKINILKDSIYSQKIANHTLTSELKYKDQLNKKTISDQSVIIQSKKLQNLFLFIGIILIFILGTVSFLFYRNRIKYLNQSLLVHESDLRIKQNEEEINSLKNEKIMLELKEKERDLANIAIHFEHYTDLLNFIKKQIEDIKLLDVNQLKKEINSLEKKIDIKVKETTNPAIFNDYFNQVHVSFFDKMKEKHPELSLNELKFCAYLKLQLSSNQIAIINNITNEAIRKTRYRIRKKLNLSQEDSLENYISQI